MTYKAEESWWPLWWWELVGVGGPLVGIRWFEADWLGTGATHFTTGANQINLRGCFVQFSHFEFDLRTLEVFSDDDWQSILRRKTLWELIIMRDVWWEFETRRWIFSPVNDFQKKLSDIYKQPSNANIVILALPLPPISLTTLIKIHANFPTNFVISFIDFIKFG